MNHLSEHTIEKLLRDSTLSQRRKSQINAHLAECSECRDVYNWLKSFYQELSRIEMPSLSDSRGVRSTVGTIKLVPLHFEKPEREKRESSIVLVAKSKEPASQYKHIVTLSSEDQQILVRVLYDNGNQTYKLFLVTPEHYDRANSVIELSACRRALVTDDAGRAEFTLESNPDMEQWKDTQGILRMPVASIKLDAEDIRHLEQDRKMTLHNNGFMFNLALSASQNSSRPGRTADTMNISVDVDSPNSFKLSKALFKEGNQRRLLMFNDGMASLRWERSSRELQIMGYR